MIKRWITWAALAVLLAGCSGGTDEAKRGVAQFRTHVAEGEFEQIYRAGGAELQQAATQEQFLAFMTAIDTKLGAWQSSAEPAWTISRGTGGHLVGLTYQSQFSRGAATERFTWRIDRGAPVLVGYHVSSPLLVMQ
jgi:hypothetical protein